MQTSRSQLVKDARKLTEIALGGLIVVLQAAMFVGVVYYFTHG